MPDQNRDPTPPATPRGEQFDPKVLDSTVIATPLLAMIKEEAALVETVIKENPGAIQEFNSAFVLPGEHSANSENVRDLLPLCLRQHQFTPCCGSKLRA